MYAISAGTLTAREGSTGLCLSLSQRIGQAIVALVTGWQRVRATNYCNLPPPMRSGKQASSESGWAARFVSSEVKVRGTQRNACRRPSYKLGPLRPYASHTFEPSHAHSIARHSPLAPITEPRANR